MASDTIIKIIIIGQEWAGKSSIMRQILNEKHVFDEAECTTVGAAFFSKVLPETDIKLHYWDTAGQERYDALLQMYYRNSSLILLVVDLADFTDSYKRMKKYLSDIEQNGYTGSYILIGNKTDKVSKEDLVKLTEKMNAFVKDKKSIHCYMEVSAKTYHNIPTLIERIKFIAKIIMEKRTLIKKTEDVIENRKTIILEPEENEGYFGYLWGMC